jgi:hypothetical protein
MLKCEPLSEFLCPLIVQNSSLESEPVIYPFENDLVRLASKLSVSLACGQSWSVFAGISDKV